MLVCYKHGNGIQKKKYTQIYMETYRADLDINSLPGRMFSEKLSEEGVIYKE